MDTAQQILYGSFPRTVGTAANDDDFEQNFVHSEGEFDIFFDHVKNDKNVYSSICRFRSDMRHVLDKVVFDFDSPMKESAFPEDYSDGDKIDAMREDGNLAEEVLGTVWEDAQRLIQYCSEHDIPAISVFSGMGVHCHLLYQDRVNPTQEKITISKFLIDECDLRTWDRKIVPDTRRVLRVPNSQRIDDGEPTGAWLIPMTEPEVLHNDVHSVLDRSRSPKDIQQHDRYQHDSRPTMEVIEGYENVDEDTVGTIELSDVSSDVSDEVEWIVRECIALPCVRERFLSPNPDHMIRFNGVVHLYQNGFTPDEVREIIQKIGWVDYDSGITKKMTDQIWNRGYSESSCNKLQSLGLCVFGPNFDDFADEPEECETHRWTSGKVLY